MAGHSQFSNIMHRKAAQDKRKTKLATKAMRDIMSAVKSGSAEPANNAVLKAAIDRAKAVNMTKDVIQRAINRGTGAEKGADFEERWYEAYGAGGVAVMVKTLTDNPTRTITNVRNAFTKTGGNVGSDGSVAWMFKPCGVIVYPAATASNDDMMEHAINAGADDVRHEEDVHRIITQPADFAEVRRKLAETLGVASESDLTYLPQQFHAVHDADTLAALEKMMEMLHNDDDVQDVITNLFSDETA
ncbi:MAG: YebC/PmpR family DNA-binding transcriptional regulator [Alphaproteobacteria bacterium]